MYTYRKYVDIATFQRYCSESTEPLRSLPNSYAVVCIDPFHPCKHPPVCVFLFQRSLSAESKDLLKLFKRLCVSHSALVLLGHMDGEEEEEAVAQG